MRFTKGVPCTTDPPIPWTHRTSLMLGMKSVCPHIYQIYYSASIPSMQLRTTVGPQAKRHPLLMLAFMVGTVISI